MLSYVRRKVGMNYTSWRKKRARKLENLQWKKDQLIKQMGSSDKPITLESVEKLRD
jgi:hypothetical protein